jgi:3-dehydroquinate dehydratase-2
MHGVNLDQLGRRDPALYGDLSLAQLERQIERDAQELELGVGFFQSNHEGAFIERLHSVAQRADGLILNPGAWSHYAWSIRDALEIAGLPAVEVHLSDVKHREQWRRSSVIAELCVATIAGQGARGYREALELLRDQLAGSAAPGGARR